MKRTLPILASNKFLADGYSVILKDSWYTVVPLL